MKKNKSKHYVVSFIFNNEGKKKKKFLRVPRGCKFLYKVRYGYKPRPSFYKGNKVIGWVNVYSADDAEGDEFAPIVRIKMRNKPFWINFSKFHWSYWLIGFIILYLLFRFMGF